MTSTDKPPATEPEPIDSPESSDDHRDDHKRRDWIIGLIAIVILIAGPSLIFAGVRQQGEAANVDNPWAGVPNPAPHVNHAELMTGTYETGSDVTVACLECHADEGTEMLHSEHWLWENPAVSIPGHDEPIALGKKNAINNFCLGIQGNEPKCTSCHAGYGWEDDTFDFTDETKIDCLVCHDQSGQYAKTDSGYVAEATDLSVAAQSVGRPTRANCAGACHAVGGGGNGVKHGDIDNTLVHPDATIDFTWVSSTSIASTATRRPTIRSRGR
jgi:hypothetical protein